MALIQKMAAGPIHPHAPLPKGQGVRSIQTLMIAELDLDPGQFGTRFSGSSPAFFNTGFAPEIARGAEHFPPAPSSHSVGVAI
jgi:hypothetical protein